MNLRKASRGRFGIIVIWVVIIAFGLGVLVLFTPDLASSLNQVGQEQQQNEPAVKVNTETVSRQDFNVALNNTIQNYVRLYQQFGQDYRQQLQGAEGAHRQLELSSQVIDQIVRDELISQEISSRGINVPGNEVETAFQVQLDDILTQNNITEQQADDILRQQGSSLRQFKDQLRDQVREQLRQDELRATVTGDLSPSDEDLLEYVEENKAQYEEQLLEGQDISGDDLTASDEELITYVEENQARYLTDFTDVENPTDEELQAHFDANSNEYMRLKARHILLNLAEDASEEDEAEVLGRIEDIRQQILDGADFAEAAIEFSEGPSGPNGGDLSEFGRGAMVAPFEEVAYKLDVDEVSEPVRTQFGFHLIQVYEQITQEFDDVTTQVRVALLEDKREAALVDFIDTAKAGDADALAQIREEAEEDVLEEKQEDLEDQALDLYLQTAKDGDATALAKVRLAAEDAYLESKETEKFEEWIEEVIAAATIEILVPEVNAFRLEADDPDAALAAYEMLDVSGDSTDPYLDYYIGSLYQKKYSELSSELQELKGKEESELTDEDVARLAELDGTDGSLETARQSAVSYLSTVAKRAADQSLFETVITTLGEESSELHYSYALAMLQANNNIRAIDQLRQAIDLDPSNVQALILYGDMQTENANYELAAEQFDQALTALGERNETDSTQYRNTRIKLAGAYLGDGQTDLSLKQNAEATIAELQANTELTEEEQNQLEDLTREVEAYGTYTEQLDRAKVLFEAIVADDSDNIASLQGLGDVYFASADYDKAKEFYDKALDVSPRAEIQVKLGNTFLAMNDYDDAERAFETAKSDNANSVEPYLGLGKVFEAQDRGDKALEEYRQGFSRARSYEHRSELGELVLALDEADTTTRFTLANLYMQQHVYSKSIEHYNKALEQDPNSIAAYWGLADSYNGRADYETAKTFFKSALNINGISDTDKIRTYEQIIDVDQRIVGFESIPGPDGLDARIELAKLELAAGNSEGATTRLDELVGYELDYRAEDIAAVREEIGTFIASRPGDELADLGNTHVETGTVVEDYNSIPPTSGNHYPTWSNWGLFTTPIPNENQVHNLEHGGVMIQHKPDLGEAALRQLVELTRELGAIHRKLTLAPYPDLDTDFAITAWTRIDKFNGFDGDRIRAFVEEYANKMGPEASIGYDGDEWWTQAPKENVLSGQIMDNGTGNTTEDNTEDSSETNASEDTSEGDE